MWQDLGIPHHSKELEAGLKTPASEASSLAGTHS